jgi:8-oxo-dGTP diphosphatase
MILPHRRDVFFHHHSLTRSLTSVISTLIMSVYMTLETATHSPQRSLKTVQLRLSVDPVLFTLVGERLHVLLRKRSWEPFAGYWALPGAINTANEQLKDSMLAELARISLGDIWVEQLKTFDRPPQYIDGALSRPGRDPRGRVVSVAYFGLVPPDRVPSAAPRDDLRWMPVDALPELAFDHDEIVHYGLWRLRNKILYSSVAFQLLPPQFTLTQLQRVYEQVLDEKLDKRNFRRKVLDSAVVVETGAMTQQGTRRPARLYRFAHGDFEYR